MELPLFGRDKDLRLVRPKRVAVLEWLRALRHNLYREWILIMDRMEHIAAEKLGPLRRPKLAEGGLPTMSPWNTITARFSPFLSGRRAAEYTQATWRCIRNSGVSTGFWPLIFVIGLLIGVGLKWGAEDSLTIGYEDYRLPPAEQLYDINALEAKFRLGLTENPNPTKIYPACTLQ